MYKPKYKRGDIIRIRYGLYKNRKAEVKAYHKRYAPTNEARVYAVEVKDMNGKKETLILRSNQMTGTKTAKKKTPRKTDLQLKNILLEILNP